jgi:hypothetical protein
MDWDILYQNWDAQRLPSLSVFDDRASSFLLLELLGVVVDNNAGPGLESPEQDEDGNHQTLQQTSTGLTGLESVLVGLLAEETFLDVVGRVLEHTPDGEDTATEAEGKVEDEHAEVDPDAEELASNPTDQTKERDDSEEDVHNDLDDHGPFGTGRLLQANDSNGSDSGTTKNTQDREEDDTSSDWDAAAESAGTNGGLVVRRHCE